MAPVVALGIQSGDFVTLCDDSGKLFRAISKNSSSWQLDLREATLAPGEPIPADAIFTVLKTADGSFIGFRSSVAEGKVLQCGKDLLLKFDNYNFKNWEQWEVLEVNEGEKEGAKVVQDKAFKLIELKNRQFPAKTLLVSLSRVFAVNEENVKRLAEIEFSGEMSEKPGSGSEDRFSDFLCSRAAMDGAPMRADAGADAGAVIFSHPFSLAQEEVGRLKQELSSLRDENCSLLAKVATAEITADLMLQLSREKERQEEREGEEEVEEGRGRNGKAPEHARVTAASFKRETEAAEHNQKVFESSLKAAEEKAQRAMECSATAEGKCDELEERLARMKAEAKAKIKKAKSEGALQVEALAAQVKILEQENKALREGGKRDGEKGESRENGSASLSCEIQEKERKVAELERQLKSANESREEGEGKLERLKRENERTEREKGELERTASEARRSSTLWESKAGEKERELEKLRAELSRLIQDKGRAERDKERAESAWGMKVGDLEAQLRGVREKLRETDSALQKEKSRRWSDEVSLEESEREKAEMAESLKALQRERAVLEAQVLKGGEMVRELEGQLGLSVARASELQGKLSELSVRLSEKENGEFVLKHQLAEKERALSVLESEKCSKMNAFENHIESLQQRANKAELKAEKKVAQRLAAAEARVIELEEKLEGCKSELVGEREKGAQFNASVEAREREMLEKEAQLVLRCQELERLSSEWESRFLSSEKERARVGGWAGEVTARAEEEREHERRELASLLEREKEAAREREGKLQAELAERVKEAAALRRETVSLQGELKRQREESERLKKAQQPGQQHSKGEKERGGEKTQREKEMESELEEMRKKLKASTESVESLFKDLNALKKPQEKPSRKETQGVGQEKRREEKGGDEKKDEKEEEKQEKEKAEKEEVNAVYASSENTREEKPSVESSVEVDEWKTSTASKKRGGKGGGKGRETGEKSGEVKGEKGEGGVGVPAEIKAEEKKPKESAHSKKHESSEEAKRGKKHGPPTVPSPPRPSASIPDSALAGSADQSGAVSDTPGGLSGSKHGGAEKATLPVLKSSGEKGDSEKEGKDREKERNGVGKTQSVSSSPLSSSSTHTPSSASSRSSPSPHPLSSGSRLKGLGNVVADKDEIEQLEKMILGDISAKEFSSTLSRRRGAKGGPSHSSFLSSASGKLPRSLQEALCTVRSYIADVAMYLSHLGKLEVRVDGRGIDIHPPSQHMTGAKKGGRKGGKEGAVVSVNLATLFLFCLFVFFSLVALLFYAGQT